jgi:prepilin-type N-terminal cleavage/methylation domain-containing protein
MTRTMPGLSRGVTLIELMIVVAVLAIIVGIAIPAYEGYIREARLGVARSNAEPLQIALEDYWLDNGTFAIADGAVWNPANSPPGNSEMDDLGWQPEGDEDKIIYAVSAGTNTYTITVTHVDLPGESVTVTRN